MSNPQPTTPATAPRKSNASRYLFLFLLGLVIGAIGVVMAMRAWDARRDHFHDSVMHVQQWHFNQLKTNVEQNRCNPNDTLPHLQTLRAMASDIEPAFPDNADDKRFVDAASNLRKALDAAILSPPMECASLGKAAGNIGESCKACHQDFR